MDLPRGFLDRLLYALVIPFFMLFLAPFVIMAHYWSADGAFLIIAKYIITDILALCFCTFLLGFIWCVFAPKWIESIVARWTPRLIFVSVVLVVGLAVALVTDSAMRAF